MLLRMRHLHSPADLRIRIPFDNFEGNAVARNSKATEKYGTPTDE